MYSREALDASAAMGNAAAQAANYIIRPTLEGKLKRGVGFWSPIGDSNFWYRLQKGHHLVARSRLVMLIPFLSLPFCFDLVLAQFAPSLFQASATKVSQMHTRAVAEDCIE